MECHLLVNRRKVTEGARGDRGMSGSFGDVLKFLREAAGLSLRAAAAAACVSHTHLWKMERGEFIPDVKLARLIDEALDGDGQLVAAARHAHGSDALNPDQKARLQRGLDNASRLDSTALVSLSDVLQAQRRLDDAIGSTPLLTPVAALMSSIEPMVIDVRGPTRSRALSVAAQWAQFAGWINTATERWDQADHWFGRALAWAAECGDQEMTATVLSFRGHVAWLTGHPAAAVSLSEAAQRDRSVFVGQKAYDLIQEARARAVMGEAREAENLLAHAIDLTGPAVAHLGVAPPWQYYRSRGAWDVEIGRAYLYIPGRAAEAAQFLEAGLAAIPEAGVEWMRSYHDDLETARRLSA